MQKKNNITLIGSSGDINLLIGENIWKHELVRKNDLIIFASGTLNKKDEYINKHITTIKEV